MPDIDFSFYIIVAILSVAYPIILQSINTIDEKVGTTDLVAYFKNEVEYKLFKSFLYIDLGVFFLFIISRFTKVKLLFTSSEYFITGVTVLTACLILSFFLLIRKLLKYTSKIEIVKYLTKLNDESEQFKEYKYFNTLSDIFCWSIKNEVDKIPETLYKYFQSCFVRYDDKTDNTIITYPNSYYNSTYRLMHELIKTNNHKFKFIENAVIGGEWLLGGFKNKGISEESYRYLWYNLLFSIQSKKDDAIVQYWSSAFSHMQFSLKQIDSLWENGKISNQEEKNRRETERSRFLEFHYALGGLLLYKKRYNCIKRIFEYTNSQPPEYVLFPKNTTEIFTQYFRFRNSYEREMLFIESRYPFPENEGVESSDRIRGWICQYIVLLAIRQYSLHEYFVYDKHVELPSLPNELNEQRTWLENIEYFNSQFNAFLKDKNLIKLIGLDFLDSLSDEWCDVNKKLRPKELFDQTKKKIGDNIEAQKKSQVLSQKQTDKFISTIKESIESFFGNSKGKLYTDKKINTNYNTQNLKGVISPIDRFAYCENTDISYGETDSIFAEMFTGNWSIAFSMIFYRMRSISYLLSEDDFFKGIDRLSLSKEKHIIISFGFHLDFYLTRVEGLTKDNYKGIPIFDYKTHHPVLSQTVIVLNKEDLPNIIFNDMPEADKTKYEFVDPINKDLKLYAKIFDMNGKTDIINEMINRYPRNNIKESVLAIIQINTEIRLKKNVEVIQIQMDSEFEQRGVLNKLSDIKKIRRYKKIV